MWLGIIFRKSLLLFPSLSFISKKCFDCLTTAFISDNTEEIIAHLYTYTNKSVKNNVKEKQEQRTMNNRHKESVKGKGEGIQKKNKEQGAIYARMNKRGRGIIFHRQNKKIAECS